MNKKQITYVIIMLILTAVILLSDQINPMNQLYKMMRIILEILVSSLYILFIIFFVMLVVRVYQALTIYILKNEQYLTNKINIIKRHDKKRNKYDNTLDAEINEENYD